MSGWDGGPVLADLVEDRPESPAGAAEGRRRVATGTLSVTARNP